MKKTFNSVNKRAVSAILMYFSVIILLIVIMGLPLKLHLYPLWLVLIGIGLWVFWKGNKIACGPADFCDICKCDLSDTNREKDVSARICEDCYRRLYAKKK